VCLFVVYLFSGYLTIPTASVVQWSEFLATDPEVLGPIPGASRCSEKQRVLERGPLSLVRTTEEVLGRNSSGSGHENGD
jgi:hypothetical protein